jgi:twitching motility protein PilT
MDQQTVDALLTSMLGTGHDISDLLFVTGKPPLIEIHGRLHECPVDTASGVIDADFIRDMADYIIGGDQRLMRDFAELGSCDCSYAIEDIARLRVNIFRQNARHAIVMRQLKTKVPTLESLLLPPVFREMLKEKNGLILVTGATGSGKTSTLAAIIDELNKTQPIHIVTLEDPIEFQHRHQKAAVNQRELGKDFPTYADGLRAALRQAPKVILVGEIRDRETMEIAMSACETGHIVFSTLHTVNAPQTISRILGMFTRDEEPQLRQRLSETLRYVVSQRLVDKVGGGRLLVTEVMGNSLRSRETLIYGESENKSFHEIIEAGSTMGWHTFDQSLLTAFAANLAAEETVMTYCTNKTRMRRELDQAKKRHGQVAQDTPSGLKLNIPEPIGPIPAVTPVPHLGMAPK